MWQLRDRTDWLFTDNLILILPNLTLALIAFVLTPSIKEGHTDIRRYCYDGAPWIFGLSAAYIVCETINTKNELGTPFSDPRNAIRAAAFSRMIALAAWKNDLFHKIAVSLGYALLAAWILVTMFRM